MAIPNVAMGWKGFLGVGAITALLPYTDADLTEKNTHIPAGDVHGGGVSQQTVGPFFSQLNVADGTLTYDGSINGNVYAGSNTFGDACRELLDRGIDGSKRLDGFTTGNPLILAPGGSGFSANGFRYPASADAESIARAVVERITVSGSAGGLITHSTSIISTTREDSTGLPSTSDLVFETTGDQLGRVNPVPWHQADFAVDVTIGEDVADRVTEWSIDVTNNSVPTDTFNRARTRRDIYQGEMEVTGTFTYYADSTVFAELARRFGSAGSPAITLTLGASDPSPIVLTMRSCALDPAPIPASDLNTLIFRQVSFRALATTPSFASLTLS